MNLLEKLNIILSRQEELTKELNKPLDSDVFIQLSKELGAMNDVAEKAKEYKQEIANMEDAKALLDDMNTTGDLKELAQEEYYSTKEKIKTLEQEIKILLLPKNQADEKNAILEIRAGTGGEEASLFGADLFRMYERYAALKGWGWEVLSYSDTGLGGIKEAVVRIIGKGVFARLKFESGVHRVQRVPETESSGRVHTSAATVAILPEADEVDVQIKDDDLDITTCRSSSAGGQHVNKTDSAIRIVHKPTGLVVECQEERSQFKNKEKAMIRLRAMLYNKELQEQQEKLASSRKSQVGSGDRSERIRTYNFPQSRVTDHRINKTSYQLEDVLNATGLDEFIDSLIAEDQLQRLMDAEI